MKFLITSRWCHPEFGGTKIECREFDLAEFLVMEEAYKQISKDDCHYKHTVVELIEKFNEG